MQHPVVTWWHQYGDRRTGNACAAVDRAQTGMHQAAATLRFMHGSDAAMGQAVDDLGVGAFDMGYHDWHG